MKKNIFLNKKYLVKWTNNASAFLVQSPFNPNAGIWWAKSWYQESKYYDDYFATGIDFNQDYQEIIYGEKYIEKINLISGARLWEQFTNLKTNNSKKYLQMTIATKQQLKNITQKQALIFKEQFISI